MAPASCQQTTFGLGPMANLQSTYRHSMLQHGCLWFHHRDSRSGKQYISTSFPTVIHSGSKADGYKGTLILTPPNHGKETILESIPRQTNNYCFKRKPLSTKAFVYFR
eukprot:scaffold3426_cov145-Amphora_coffeaeformis.AAC.4